MFAINKNRIAFRIYYISKENDVKNDKLISIIKRTIELPLVQIESFPIDVRQTGQLTLKSQREKFPPYSYQFGINIEEIRPPFQIFKKTYVSQISQNPERGTIIDIIQETVLPPDDDVQYQGGRCYDIKIYSDRPRYEIQESTIEPTITQPNNKSFDYAFAQAIQNIDNIGVVIYWLEQCQSYIDTPVLYDLLADDAFDPLRDEPAFERFLKTLDL